MPSQCKTRQLFIHSKKCSIILKKSFFKKRRTPNSFGEGGRNFEGPQKNSLDTENLSFMSYEGRKLARLGKGLNEKEGNIVQGHEMQT